MAWTLPTALFFIAIGTGLVCMTIAELKWPGEERRGWLPMVTTRGDRFFISLLTAAYIHLFWLGLMSMSVLWASLLALVAAVFIMRWG